MERIPPGGSALLALFEERRDLKFPDVDVDVLRGAMAEVDDAFDSAQALEDELTRAKEHLAAKQDAFLAKAQRALAYAKLFAEEDPQLADRLSQVILPRGRKPVVARGEPPALEVAQSAPNKPRRKRPVREDSETLFAPEETRAVG